MTTLYLPDPTDFLKLLITWCIALVLTLAGAAAVGRRQPPEVQIVAGWGALCLLLTVWGVLVPFNLAIPATGFAAMAVLVFGLRRRRTSSGAWKTLGRAIVVTLPLWIILAPIRPSQPDTWINLLPNALYLVDWGRLPAATLPPDHSYLPAAPYNTQFLSYLGGLVWPGYPAAGMSLMNVLLLLATGLLVARAMAVSRYPAEAVLSWGIIATGMLLVTLLNPGFVPRFHLSPYGETALAVTAVMAAWLLVSAQGDLALGRATPGTASAVALILAAMVDAKQSGIGLVLSSNAAALVTSCAESGRQRPKMLLLIALTALPSLALYALWRFHASVAGVQELRPLPLAEWNWNSISDAAASTARVVSEKAIYFSFVLLSFFFVPILWRRRGWTPATRMLTFHAGLFIFYNIFLLIAYLTVFSPTMSDEAHSYFRYNTHLSLVLVLALVLALRDLAPASWLWRCRTRQAGAAALGLALLVPVAFIKRLRFDLDMPQPLVWDLAKDLVPYLHKGDRLALLLPGDNGSVATMLAGVLADTPPRRRGLALLHFSTADRARLDEAGRRGYPLALISCTPAGWQGLPAGRAVLLSRDGDDWRLIAAWPYPPAALRQRWQYILSWAPLCRDS